LISRISREIFGNLMREPAREGGGFEDVVLHFAVELAAVDAARERQGHYYDGKRSCKKSSFASSAKSVT
jgi:hypothetical protein